ncbi:MAG: DUF6600 domain-containing protein [Thermodesulfobacteriota bacterium]
MTKFIGALWCAILGLVSLAQAQEPVLIGRVVHIEGGVLRYVTAEDDWVGAVADSPLRADDIVYTEPEGRAEFIFPNSTWVRVGGNTGVDLVMLRRDLTGLYVDAGVVRIYNRSADALVRVETRLGYVAAEPGDIVDLYVGDAQIQVIALEGSPNFFYYGRGREEIRYEVVAAGPAIFIDEAVVEAAEPLVDRAWDQWNYERDQLWLERRKVRSAHLPEPLQTDAHVFETYGRWERVYYREKYIWCWTPIHVDVAWRPFTVGRWTTYYEENVWIPYEPWGWVTHHHGHWIHVENRWWWTPYVSVNVVTPGASVSVEVGVPPPPDFHWHWHPGRVAWIHNEVHVGWFPLAPWEPYYGWHPWYGNTVVVNNTNITNININIANYNYYNNAVIVNYDRFYNVPYGNNYIQHNLVNVTNINRTTIINNYYAAPVIHKTVIKNTNVFKNQYNFSDRHVVHKPHHTFLEKVNHGKAEFQKRGIVSAADYHQRLGKVMRADPIRSMDSTKHISGLAAKNRMVRGEEVRRPVDQVKFESRGPKLEKDRPKLHDAERQSARAVKESASRRGPLRETTVDRGRRMDRAQEPEGSMGKRTVPRPEGRKGISRPDSQEGTSSARQGESGMRRGQTEGRQALGEDRPSGRRLRPDAREKGRDPGRASLTDTGDPAQRGKLDDRSKDSGSKADRGLQRDQRGSRVRQLEERARQGRRQPEESQTSSGRTRIGEPIGGGSSLVERSGRTGTHQDIQRGREDQKRGGPRVDESLGPKAAGQQDRSVRPQEPGGRRSPQEPTGLSKQGQSSQQDRRQPHVRGEARGGEPQGSHVRPDQQQQRDQQQRQKQLEQQQAQERQRRQQPPHQGKTTPPHYKQQQAQERQRRQQQQQLQQQQRDQQQRQKQLEQQQAQERQGRQQQQQLQQQQRDQHQRQKQLEQQQAQERQRRQLEQQQAQQRHEQQQLHQQRQQPQDQGRPGNQRQKASQEEQKRKKKQMEQGQQPQ